MTKIEELNTASTMKLTMKDIQTRSQKLQNITAKTRCVASLVKIKNRDGQYIISPGGFKGYHLIANVWGCVCVCGGGAGVAGVGVMESLGAGHIVIINTNFSM